MAEPVSIPTFEEWREKQKKSSEDCGPSKRARPDVYDPTKEPLPNHKFFQLDRGAIDGGLQMISAAVLDALSRARPQDKQLSALQTLARSFQKVSLPENLDVAVVGEQGLGKSLAINALQHRPNLSTTSASGGACTASAIRFCYKPDAAALSDSFDAKIKFMNDEELMENIQEHIDRYYHFHFSGHVEEETYFEDQSAAEDAEDFFDLLHNSKHDREAASQLKILLNADNIQENNLLKATMSMAHRRINETRARWPTGEERTIVFKDRTIKDLMKEIEQYMVMVPSMPSLWPIVQSLDILLWSVLAKHGVNLRDLPGLNDENQIRTAATNAFRRKAGYEMIFARADRVTTDTNVHKYIRQSIKAHGAKRTILILTKKDEYLLDTNSVEKIIKTRTVEPFPTIHDHVDRNEKMMDMLPDGDEAAEAEYADREAYCAHLENLAKLDFIHHRGEEVTQEMKDKFKEMDKDPITVFSISASMYMDWMKKRRSKQPMMSPEDTGVPGVRQYLLNLCAEPNLIVYKEHAFEKMDDLLDKCRRITDVEKRHEGYGLLRPVFAKAVDDIRKNLSRIFNDFIKHNVEDVFDDEDMKQERQEELLEVVNNWAYGSPWNTYRACLMRKGIGRSAAAKYQNHENPTGAYNWNEDQGNVTIGDMEDWGRRMLLAIKELSGRLERAIASGCEAIEECIQASSLPPELRDNAIEEWLGCRMRVEQVHADKMLLLALDVTLQYATTETDVKCMNVRVNVDHYKSVYGYDRHVDTRFANRLAAQKNEMHRLMSKPDEQGRLLIDRIENAAIMRSKSDLRDAFAEFSVSVIRKIKAFDEHLSDRGPLDYTLTDTDRQLREDILGRIPALEAMVEDVRTKFNDNMLLVQPAVTSSSEEKAGEPAQKQIKVE
ncbi:hypothetical protein PMIN01_07040 [Paraphaeosphaeria minitans]|uniref:Dynamin N-terminal domain-containing protein n=1 Tax=Paraphaeosphaeria minitans TaxID=565426 RepID=A0A9P6GJQ6_9PLEO|nr:hypothetical protein PMIN01_07040 [Paraphaeosphaeria minitans]